MAFKLRLEGQKRANLQRTSERTVLVRGRNVGKCQRQEETVMLMELQMCRQTMGTKGRVAGDEVKNTHRSHFMYGFLGNVKFVI